MKIYSESINIYKITFYSISSILIRITGYLVFLSFLFNIFLINTEILNNINLKYIYFFFIFFSIILLFLHFFTGFCKTVCNDFKFLDLENKNYTSFIKIHLIIFNFLISIFFFILMSLNYIINLDLNLINIYL